MLTDTERMLALCKIARLLPEEILSIPGLGAVPTVAGARKVAALMPAADRPAFLKRAATAALSLTPDAGERLPH